MVVEVDVVDHDGRSIFQWSITTLSHALCSSDLLRPRNESVPKASCLHPALFKTNPQRHDADTDTDWHTILATLVFLVLFNAVKYEYQAPGLEPKDTVTCTTSQQDPIHPHPVLVVSCMPQSIYLWSWMHQNMRRDILQCLAML